MHLAARLLLGRALLALVREVGQGLPTVVHDLVGVLDDLVDVRRDLHWLLPTVSLAFLALLIACMDVLLEEAAVNGVHNL